ncbi:MAG: hypothetical protein M1822_008794 [Bathelium mastoideum]|nr:MAG: hypothetical protein M1822_008794 [Bathelium mastoideum]
MEKTSDHEFGDSVPIQDEIRNDSVVNTSKGRWERVWPVIACGAGLFSDGYLNSVIGSVSTILSKIYPKEYKSSPARQNYTSDHFSRKWTLLVSTIILIIFAALCAGSYGAGDSVTGLFAALTAYRFFLGLGIGGEYPAGSVGCAESTGELKSGTRNRWFIWFTNVQIDFGFLVAAIVPMIVVLATTENHLKAAWRICLGLGVIPPLSLLWLRIKLKEPEAFKRESMAKAKTPYWLIIRLYWWRLLVVSLIWFLYDFSGYAFSIYSSTILANLQGNDSRLWVSFGWNTLINFFYIPGCLAGSYISDWVGPRYTLAGGVFIQAVFGFIMAGCYATLSQPSHTAAFVVVYGLFLAFGEVGPGDNIGLVASKTCATAVRGQYYGIAAAVGKIGAFVGTYVFPDIQAAAGSDVVKQGQYPFWVASCLCMFEVFLAVVCLPKIGQDTIDEEDRRFRQYLIEHGYDTSMLGLKTVDSEVVVESQTAAPDLVTKQ